MRTPIFQWLHLSDIHFLPDPQTFNDERLRTTLPNYVREKCKECDTLIISGDFRYAPKKEDTNANQVIEYIHQLAGQLNIGDDHVVLVPGNHDLERSKMRDYHIRGTREDYNPNIGEIDDGVMEQLAKDFTFYSSVQDSFRNSLRMDVAPHSIIDMGASYLLLLNTAIVAGRDDDEHNLVLGTKYIAKLFGNVNKSKPIIAIGHHGFNMLNEVEKKEVARYFDDNGVRLYLCGHEHDNGLSSFGNYGKQVNVGCMKQGIDNIVAGFAVGTLYDNGDVEIAMHKWDREGKIWIKDERNKDDISNLYPDNSQNGDARVSEAKVPPVNYPLYLKGYQLLSHLGGDGIKYVWEREQGKIFESVAFNRRTKFAATQEDEHISAYTISCSKGCSLSTFDSQCLFCQTGQLPYQPLTAEELALQCIFMAEYDSDCPSYPQIRTNSREFAFMGQGEPGFCYDIVKRAILLNDYAMKKVGQQVSRYIISTCGITDFIPSLTYDCESGIYANKVTLHLSLNAIDADRDTIMPINKMFNYQDVINQSRRFYERTGSKVGVGILLMVDYKTSSGNYISLDSNKLKAMLQKIAPEAFKVDFCTVNNTKMGSQRQLSMEDAQKFLDIASSMGFESKLFSSIGDSANVGCGMLNSSIDDINEPGNKTITHYNHAVELLEEAKQNI